MGGAEKETWVQCDRCQKWRRVPVQVAEGLTDEDKWFCKENPDQAFNRCKVPQEMSDAEINRQLGIESDQEAEQQEADGEDTDEGEEDASSSESEEPGTPPPSRGGDRKPAVWQLTRQNLFVTRRKKAWKDEEVMVCQCWPPPPGKPGCLEDCLNRMVKVECLAKHCPCGDACTNQQFQRRAYRQLEVTRCGSKGFGLRALEDIPKQTFFIEYTGEVLDEVTFEGRLREYARAGQRHMYFMTIGNGEYIDACQKGNLGRFINHSCNPNSEVQKWQVRGELCVGMFTLRDVRAGEELTFDYNYDKSRKDAKPCLCGEPQCRGWIGGDLSSPAAKKVQARLERARERGTADSAAGADEELEPIMLPEEAGAGEEAEGEGEEAPADMAVVLEGNARFQAKQAKLLEVALQYRSKGQPDLEAAEKQLAKKRKKGTEPEGAGQSSKKVKVGGSRARLPGRGGGVKGGGVARSGVEKELAALVDEEGGLERRKGAAQEFITLLAQAEVAGGDGAGGRKACSARDLMALLEALLKTHSRSVLKDFVATNGLEVVKSLLLHLREDPSKPPVLRKLVRVLEFLADQGFLRQEHLLQAHPPAAHAPVPPPSLADALGLLERHTDRELQARARQFRLKMLPLLGRMPAAPAGLAPRRQLSPPRRLAGPSYNWGSDPELAQHGGRLPLPQDAAVARGDAHRQGPPLGARRGQNGLGDGIWGRGPADGSGRTEMGTSSGVPEHDREVARGGARPASPLGPPRPHVQQGSTQGPQSQSPEWGPTPSGRQRDNGRSDWRAHQAEPPQGGERRAEGVEYEGRSRMHHRWSPPRGSGSPAPLHQRERSPRRERRRTGFSDSAGDPWASGSGGLQQEHGASAQECRQTPTADKAPRRDGNDSGTPAGSSAGAQAGTSSGVAPVQLPADVSAAPASPRTLEAEGRRKMAVWQQRMQATILAGEEKGLPTARSSKGGLSGPGEAGSTPPPWGARGAPPPSSSSQAAPTRAPWEAASSRPGGGVQGTLEGGGRGIPSNGLPAASAAFASAPWNHPAPPGTGAPWPHLLERGPLAPGQGPLQPPPPGDGTVPPPPPADPPPPPPPPPAHPFGAQPLYSGGAPPLPQPGQFPLPPPPLPPQPMRPAEGGYPRPPSLPPYPPPPVRLPFQPARPPLPAPPLPNGPPAPFPPAPGPAQTAPTGLPNGVPAQAGSPMIVRGASAGELRRGEPATEDSRDWISDEPTSSDFQHLVMEIVRYRMAAYKFKIQKNKAEEICSKLTGKIISGEKKAYQEREKQGQGNGPRPLQKSVLGAKVKKFVVDYMEQYLAKAGNVAP